MAYEPTSGEPHIAVSILDSVFRIVFLVLTLFLLYEGITKGYWLGHEIFNPTAVEAEPGRMRTVTIEESESTLRGRRSAGTRRFDSKPRGLCAAGKDL